MHRKRVCTRVPRATHVVFGGGRGALLEEHLGKKEVVVAHRVVQRRPAARTAAQRCRGVSAARQLLRARVAAAVR
jgi:hypothetical protein